MSAKSVQIGRFALHSLVRAALGSLRSPGDVIEIPGVVDEGWLRRYVTRLHRRSTARYRVRARMRAFYVTRVTDQPECLL